jgi:hypothetical protein
MADPQVTDVLEGRNLNLNNNLQIFSVDDHYLSDGQHCDLLSAQSCNNRL